MGDEQATLCRLTVRHWMAEQERSLAWVARKVGYTRAYLSKVLHGRLPFTERLARACTARLGVRFAESDVAVLLLRVEYGQDRQEEERLLNEIRDDFNLKLKVLSRCRHAHPRIVQRMAYALEYSGLRARQANPSLGGTDFPLSLTYWYWVREAYATVFDASDGLVAMRTARTPANLEQLCSVLVSRLSSRLPRQTRALAACVLGKLGHAQTVEPLILAAVLDEEATVRAAALHALGEVGTAQVIKALIVGLRNTDEEAHMNAVYALGQIGATAGKSLIAALRDPKAVVRVGAAVAIGRGCRGAAWVIEPLIAVLQDPEPVVRVGACWALGEVGDAGAGAPLIATLQDQAAEVRQAAAHALGLVGGAHAVEPLLRVALRDVDEAVRDRAARALDRRGMAAVERLLAAVQEGTGETAAPTPHEPLPKAGREGWSRAKRTLISIGAALGAPLRRLGHAHAPRRERQGTWGPDYGAPPGLRSVSDGSSSPTIGV